MKSKLLALGLTCANALFSQTHPQLSPLSAAIKRARPSIVRVVVVFGQGPNEGTSAGTGFTINREGFVITARHVVVPVEGGPAPSHIVVEWPLKTMEGHFEAAGNFSSTDAVIKTEDKEHDLIVLAPNANPFSPEFKESATKFFPGASLAPIAAARLEARHLDEGESIFTTGYPFEIPNLVTTAGYIASANPFPRGVMSGPPKSLEDLKALSERRQSELDDFYLADMVCNHGNSGGPVFSLASGRVIGVMVAFLTDTIRYRDGAQEEFVNPQTNRTLIYNAGLAKIIAADHVIALLKQNNIRVE
ncbi:MAG: serine protease [Bryobacteraceae bacterium]